MRKNYIGAAVTVAVVILGLLVLCVLLACSVPLAPETPNVHVVNSAWQVVREDVVGRTVSSTDSLEADVADYNAAHTDDQWRIIYGDVPPIEAAPTADAFIVYADSHDIEAEYRGIQRADLMERRASWRLQTELDSATSGRACVLYVDNVPPAPVPVAPPDPYVLYACYVVDSAGAVVYEEHPAADGYAAVARAYSLEVELHNATTSGAPWTFVTGRMWP